MERVRKFFGSIQYVNFVSSQLRIAYEFGLNLSIKCTVRLNKNSHSTASTLFLSLDLLLFPEMAASY